MHKKLTSDSKPTDFPEKTTVYEVMCTFNLHLKNALYSLDRLRTFGMFRNRSQRDSMETCQAAIEEIRARINFEATETMHEREERDRSQFRQKREQLEKQYEDSRDAFLLAEPKRKPTAKTAKKG